VQPPINTPTRPL